MLWNRSCGEKIDIKLKLVYGSPGIDMDIIQFKFPVPKEMGL